MRISFDLSDEDLLAIQRYWLKRKSILFQETIFAVGLVMSFLFVFSQKFNQGYWINFSNQAITFLANFVISYLIFIAVVFLYRKTYLRRTRRGEILESPYLGNNSLEVLDDKIVLETKTLKLEILISGIKRVLVEKLYAIIFLGKERAITIPRNTEGLNQFIELLKEKKTNANTRKIAYP